MDGDIERVKAASKAFYTALAVIDNGEAMAKVWAHTPYITIVGPRSKSITVGWDANKKYWEEANKACVEKRLVVRSSYSREWQSCVGDRSGDGRNKIERRHRREGRLDRNQRVRETRRQLAHSLPPCAAETTVSANSRPKRKETSACARAVSRDFFTQLHLKLAAVFFCGSSKLASLFPVRAAGNRCGERRFDP